MALANTVGKQPAPVRVSAVTWARSSMAREYHLLCAANLSPASDFGVWTLDLGLSGLAQEMIGDASRSGAE